MARHFISSLFIELIIRFSIIIIIKPHISGMFSNFMFVIIFLALLSIVNFFICVEWWRLSHSHELLTFLSLPAFKLFSFPIIWNYLNLSNFPIINIFHLWWVNFICEISTIPRLKFMCNSVTQIPARELSHSNVRRSQNSHIYPLRY